MIINFNFIVLLTFILAYISFMSLILVLNGTKFNLKKEFINFGLYMSVIAVIAATLFPIRFNIPYKGFEIYNYIPFKIPITLYMKYGFEYFFYQTLGNVALFVPFGFFVYTKSKFNLKITILTCFLLTLLIEFTQGFIPYRFCEIDDLWLNTLGGFIGAKLSIYYLKFNDKYKKINNIN